MFDFNFTYFYSCKSEQNLIRDHPLHYTAVAGNKILLINYRVKLLWTLYTHGILSSEKNTKVEMKAFHDVCCDSRTI